MLYLGALVIAIALLLTIYVVWELTDLPPYIDIILYIGLVILIFIIIIYMVVFVVDLLGIKIRN